MTKTKVKEGNGTQTQPEANEQRNVPARTNEAARPLARTGGHPLSRLHDEIDTLFNHFFGGWPMPFEGGWGQDRFWNMDVHETDKEVLVRAEAPGFEPQEFDISISGNTLSIQAEHKEESQDKERGWQRRYGRFQRSFTLPAAVDADKVEATYRQGVLELRLPKAEEAQRRRIEVKQ